jgi:hypothetical protein
MPNVIEINNQKYILDLCIMTFTRAHPKGSVFRKLVERCEC